MTVLAGNEGRWKYDEGIGEPPPTRPVFGARNLEDVRSRRCCCAMTEDLANSRAATDNGTPALAPLFRSEPRRAMRGTDSNGILDVVVGLSLIARWFKASKALSPARPCHHEKMC